MDALHCLVSLACVLSDLRHDAHALRLDEDLGFLAGVASDGLGEGIVGSEEPLAVPSVFQDGFLHGPDVLKAGIGLGSNAFAAADGLVGSAVFHEHAGDEDAFGNGAFARACCLEAFARVLREAVQVEAVVPVGPADQRQLVRAKMGDGVVEAASEMLHQRLGKVVVVVERNHLV